MDTPKPKVQSGKCRYCGKQFHYLSLKQLNHNIAVHELSCKTKILNEVNKEVKRQNDKKDNTKD